LQARCVSTLVIQGTVLTLHYVSQYGWLAPPPSPLLRHVPDPEGELHRMLNGFELFEERLKYRFRDRAYLLQAMSHASFSPNRLTDCYQRLEFLGDAVLGKIIILCLLFFKILNERNIVEYVMVPQRCS
jgi:hypothetical protein